MRSDKLCIWLCHRPQLYILRYDSVVVVYSITTGSRSWCGSLEYAVYMTRHRPSTRSGELTALSCLIWTLNEELTTERRYILAPILASPTKVRRARRSCCVVVLLIYMLRVSCGINLTTTSTTRLESAPDSISDPTTLWSLCL